jgi:hypothetical protein
MTNSFNFHVFQDCLSGDGKSLMIVNISPTTASSRETQCSLRFASQVKNCYRNISFGIIKMDLLVVMIHFDYDGFCVNGVLLIALLHQVSKVELGKAQRNVITALAAPAAAANPRSTRSQSEVSSITESSLETHAKEELNRLSYDSESGGTRRSFISFHRN